MTLVVILLNKAQFQDGLYIGSDLSTMPTFVLKIKMAIMFNIKLRLDLEG
jgi:hypothetical protein